MKSRLHYKHTLRASYLASASTAAVNNFVPLLFLTFQQTFGISLELITLLVTINFVVQLIVDLLAAVLADHLSYRVGIVSAQTLSALGLAGLAFLPDIMPSAFGGILICVVCYAIGGGLNEVFISPIVEACPTEHKSAAMSLLHSFYCWGSIAVVLGSTAMFRLLGVNHWRIISLIWAVIPALNAVYFTQVPLFRFGGHERVMGVGKLLRSPLFWVLGLLMLSAGAAELSMSQWASAFAEAGLGVSKTMGDLMGPCLFAVTMGIARLLHSKLSKRLPLMGTMAGCGVLCVISYLLVGLAANPTLALAGCALCGLSVGVMWPGALSLGAARFPAGGTALFALLAVGGDLGCSVGPTLVGFVAAGSGGNLSAGLTAALVFPVLLLGCLAVCGWMVRKKALK